MSGNHLRKGPEASAGDKLTFDRLVPRRVVGGVPLACAAVFVVLYKPTPCDRSSRPPLLTAQSPSNDITMSVWLALLSAVFVACLLHYRRPPRNRLPFPPGPHRLPFVGNVFDMPKRYSGADYRALTDKYGAV